MENVQKLITLTQKYNELSISDQIDYKKFYLYSIITHSTAIEGSTVTEVEAQLLFDEGITSNKRTLTEQMMNLDLKNAYEYGIQQVKHHHPITTNSLITLASKVMEHTGSAYHSIAGDFNSAKGELRKLNVTAGIGGKSYMSYQKVPARLEAFCTELNKRRQNIDIKDIASVYELSFWAHYELVTIHPWADGNGRTSRLLMNLIQMEYDVLPTKILKENKADYIQSLVNTRESDDIEIFINAMTNIHCQHLKTDIDLFTNQDENLADKLGIMSELADKWSVKPSISSKMADILILAQKTTFITTKYLLQNLDITETTAKRYLRQLTEFGYLEATGGNKNKTYHISAK